MTSAPDPEAPFDRSWLRQALVVLVTIKLTGIVLIFDTSGLQSFDFPKSLFSRATEWLMVGLLGAIVLRFGVGVLPRTRLHLIAAGFVLAYALSALNAENGYIALYGDRDRYLGLTFVIDMAVLYLGVAVGFRESADWRALAGGVAAASVLVIAYTWIQFFGMDPFGWSLNPTDRPFSTLGQPDHLGHYLSLLFGGSVALAVLGRTDVPLAARAVAGMFSVVVLATAAIVATRGTLLGVAAVLAVLPFALLRARSVNRRAVAAAALLIVAAFVILSTLVAFTPLGARARDVGGDNSVESRVALFGAAARMFVSRPLLGFGPDHFGVALPRFREPDNAPVLGDAYHNSAHDWLLQAAATAGAAGLLATVALVAGSLVALWRAAARRPGVVASALLLASVGYWTHATVTVGSISVDWLPWLALGTAASFAPRSLLLVPRRPLLRAVGGTALGIASIAGVITGWSAFSANRAAGAARQEAAARPQIAIDAGEAAVRADGARAEYWDWLGDAYAAAGRWRDAACAYQEAADRAPHEWVYWANLATSRVRAATAESDKDLMLNALATARRVVEVAPNEPRPHIILADTAFAAGAYDLALVSAVSAIALDPRVNADASISRSAARALDLAEARRLLEKAVALRDTATLHVALAQVALKAGDTAGASRHAQRALQLAPANTEAMQILRATGG